MSDWGTAIRGAIQNGFCTIAQNASELKEFFDGPGGLVPDLPNPGAIAYRHFCNNEPPPTPTPPFEGGQCVCRLYNVTASGSDSTGGFSFTAQFWGPISDLSEGTNPSGTNLKITSYGSGSAACRQQPITNSWGDRILYPPISVQYSISTADGLPDECGSLPAPIEPLPPEWNIYEDNDFTYIDNSGTEINIPISLAFGYANLSFEGKLQIPFTLKVGPNDFSLVGGDINLFERTINFRPRNNYWGNPGFYLGPGDGNLPVDPPPIPTINMPAPPPITEDEERGQAGGLIGAIVTVSSLSPNSGLIYQEDGNPDVIIPDAGLINFFFRVGTRSGAWSEDIRIKNRRQFVPTPGGFLAVSVEGTPREGVEWVITPVYGKKGVDSVIPNQGSLTS